MGLGKAVTSRAARSRFLITGTSSGVSCLLLLGGCPLPPPVAASDNGWLRSAFPARSEWCKQDGLILRKSVFPGNSESKIKVFRNFGELLDFSIYFADYLPFTYLLWKDLLMIVFFIQIIFVYRNSGPFIHLKVVCRAAKACPPYLEESLTAVRATLQQRKDKQGGCFDISGSDKVYFECSWVAPTQTWTVSVLNLNLNWFWKLIVKDWVANSISACCLYGVNCQRWLFAFHQRNLTIYFPPLTEMIHIKSARNIELSTDCSSWSFVSLSVWELTIDIVFAKTYMCIWCPQTA